MNPGGLVLESFPLERRAATLDLVLLIIETPGSLSASMRYNTDLFQRSTIARMSRHFETLLLHVVAQPALNLSALKALLAETDGQEQVGIRNAHRELNLQKLHQVKRKAVSASHLRNDGVEGMSKYTNANGRY
jgi:non-ribosomal peptide synthetase component F